jgi:thiosulfate reductase cytochrome b subunit
MKRLVSKHPRAIRWFHWINVPLLSLMIYSGLLIYWANDVYRIGWGSFTLFKFFPDLFYQLLGLDHHLADGMAWHFTIMWVFILNGLCYVTYTIWSGEWRYLVPDHRSFGEAWQVIRHDLGLRKEPLPPGKFNAAQKFAYTGVVGMGAASVLTGLAIYKPTQLAWLAICFGGYQNTRAIHFYLTLGYVLFVCVHLAQVFRAGWNNFRAMLTGYEVETTREPDHA